MRVIAVLDILQGKVVHGKEGKRDQYETVDSLLLPENIADPMSVMSAFRKKLGLNNFYIADLDAIRGTGDNFDIIRKLTREFADCNFFVDAGIAERKDLKQIKAVGADHVIIASETLTDWQVLEAAASQKQFRPAVSVDFKNGNLQTGFAGNSVGVRDILNKSKAVGIRDVILLDVGKVGTSSGISERIIKLRHRFPDFNFITGGGIRNRQDLEQLQRHNFFGALVATALHHRQLDQSDLKKIEKPRVAWGLTGCGHHLSQIQDIIKNLRHYLDIDIFLSRAAREVLSIYNIEFSEPLYQEKSASSPPVGNFYHGVYDALIIAPVTSNTAAKMVLGISDTLITNIFAQAGKTDLPLLVLPGDNRREILTKAPGQKQQLRVYPREIDLQNTAALREMRGVEVADSPKEVESWIKNYLSLEN